MWIIIIKIYLHFPFYSGGNGEYFVDNITNFHLIQSTFDLALITTFKCIVLFLLYSKLEDVTMKQVQNPFDGLVNRNKLTLHILIIIFSLLFFVYPIIKGGFILNAILNQKYYEQMHLTYNILVISAVAFSFVELLMSLGSFGAMRRLKVQRILHRLNDDLREVDEDGKQLNQKVNIVRLVSLIKSVSEGGRRRF